MRRHVLTWLLTAALLACAWMVSKAALPDSSTIEAFPATAQIGEETGARNLVVTVTDARIASRVSDAAGWTADGNWLVIDLEAAGAGEHGPSALSLAELTIGERTFSATERGTTFARQVLVTGVPRSGSLAFELPDDETRETGVLRLGIPTGARGEVLLDGVIDLPLDLSTLPVSSEIVLDENGWARR